MDLKHNNHQVTGWYKLTSENATIEIDGKEYEVQLDHEADNINDGVQVDDYDGELTIGDLQEIEDFVAGLPITNSEYE